jgi:hypothetical protein
MKLFEIPMLVTSLFGLCLLSGLETPAVYADFTFGERVNLKTTIPAIDPMTDAITCFSYDGLEVYILSSRPGESGSQDLWVLRRASIDDDWGPPENLGPAVNSPQDDLSASISGDGLTLCFCSNRPTGSGRHDIYMTTRAARNAPWGNAVNMGTPINTSSDDVEPWITADGLELYYASYRAGGYGYCDIWGTKRTTTNDPWGQPVNLGPLVNSPYEEHVTALSPDGLLLLFAGCRTCGSCPTPRPGGYGGDDMWMARRVTLSDPWQPAVNLGPIVNGPADNYFPRISPDGSTLYYIEYLGGIWDDYQVPILPLVDLYPDGAVEMKDFSTLAQYWGQDEPSVDIGPMPWGDGVVDIQDLAVLLEYWLSWY